MLLEDALQHNLELWQMDVGELLARYRAPRLEPLPPGGKRADAGLDAVRDHEQRVEREQRWQLGLIGLELFEGGPDGGVLVRGVLELKENERQTVDKEDHVRTSCWGTLQRAPTLCDRKLVDREPVIRVWVLKVDDLGNAISQTRTLTLRI